MDNKSRKTIKKESSAVFRTINTSTTFAQAGDNLLAKNLICCGGLFGATLDVELSSELLKGGESRMENEYRKADARTIWLAVIVSLGPIIQASAQLLSVLMG